jgi:predicted acylesterase/phospholipase RssA
MPQPQEPPEDRFCDLVMKGGITSGVIYPKAIELLSHHYRFNGIGGTSAGAIAAVVTAAAEYQRRHTGSRAGFDLLAKLPTDLGTVSAGKSKLLSLFQPQPEMRRLFSVLIKALNSSSTNTRIYNIVSGLLLAYWPATLAAFVTALAVGAFGLGWFAAGLTLVFALLGLIGLWVYRDVTRKLVTKDFGLCTGMTENRGNEPALTPWLHELIQTAAGGIELVGDKPLTFGDLWAAPGFPSDWLKLPTGSTLRSIDLQMFSTNLSHGRPYIFPLPETDSHPTRFRDRERLYFKEEEMKCCLPPNVVAWMVDKSKPYTMEPGREGKDPPTSAAEGRRSLPEPRDFPVLLAARMSLSFPFLFTAIPLHAIDHDPPKNRQFRHCWFSDGGISSNFPMHLFDDLVPVWPTFGINLEPEVEGRGLFFLPKKYDQGYGERWSHFAEETKPASKLGGFIGAIVGTMQNWNDNSLARMPGVRDRVARVRLKEEEGGMNLNMNGLLIEAIAKRGVEATQELVQRFAITSSNGVQAEGWDEHRFVRLHVLLKMITARSPGLVSALDSTCQHATDFTKLLDDAMTATDKDGNLKLPPGYETPMTKEQREELGNFVKELKSLAAFMANQPQPIPFKPIPNPELRVRPPL